MLSKEPVVEAKHSAEVVSMPSATCSDLTIAERCIKPAPLHPLAREVRLAFGAWLRLFDIKDSTVQQKAEAMAKIEVLIDKVCGLASAEVTANAGVG